MKPSFLIYALISTTQLFAAELRDVINDPTKYFGQRVDLVGIAQVEGTFYLFPDEVSFENLDSSKAVLVRYRLSPPTSYRDFDREWVRVTGIMSPDARSGWYPGTGVFLERVEVLHDRPRPHIKTDWVRGVFNNPSNRSFKVQFRGDSKIKGGFLIKPHNVREEIIHRDDHQLVLLVPRGSAVSEGGKVLAQSSIDFQKLPPDYQYLPESSVERRFYFRLEPGRIDQVPASEGKRWKIDLPVY